MASRHRSSPGSNLCGNRMPLGAGNWAASIRPTVFATIAPKPSRCPRLPAIIRQDLAGQY